MEILLTEELVLYKNSINRQGQQRSGLDRIREERDILRNTVKPRMNLLTTLCSPEGIYNYSAYYNSGRNGAFYH